MVVTDAAAEMEFAAASALESAADGGSEVIEGCLAEGMTKQAADRAAQCWEVLVHAAELLVMRAWLRSVCVGGELGAGAGVSCTE